MDDKTLIFSEVFGGTLLVVIFAHMIWFGLLQICSNLFGSTKSYIYHRLPDLNNPMLLEMTH